MVRNKKKHIKGIIAIHGNCNDRRRRAPLSAILVLAKSQDGCKAIDSTVLCLESKPFVGAGYRSSVIKSMNNELFVAALAQ